MTYDEAKEEASKINNDSTGWFCPHIRGMCDKRCVCLTKSEPYRIGSTIAGVQWLLRDRRCTYKKLN